jgi:hypothetical protein
VGDAHSPRQWLGRPIREQGRAASPGPSKLVSSANPWPRSELSTTSTSSAPGRLSLACTVKDVICTGPQQRCTSGTARHGFVPSRCPPFVRHGVLRPTMTLTAQKVISPGSGHVGWVVVDAQSLKPPPVAAEFYLLLGGGSRSRTSAARSPTPDLAAARHRRPEVEHVEHQRPSTAPAAISVPSRNSPAPRTRPARSGPTVKGGPYAPRRRGRATGAGAHCSRTRAPSRRTRRGRGSRRPPAGTAARGPGGGVPGCRA